MQIRIGYDIGYGADAATPMVIMLNVHPSRHGDLVGTEMITTAPDTPITSYRDGFGNVCGRLVVPAGGVVPRAIRANAASMAVTLSGASWLTSSLLAFSTARAMV